MNVASQARRDRQGRILTPLINNRTGQLEYRTAEEMEDLVVAPQMKEIVPGYVSAIGSGREGYYKPEQVTHRMPDPETGFSSLSNLSPFKLFQPHNRLAMGSRFLSQAVPLVRPEAPLVRNAVPGTNEQVSFETLYRDRVGTVSSQQDGQVVDIRPDRIVIATVGPDGRPKNKTHWLHRHTPLGSKTALINRPVVQVGQTVRAGDLLAASNFSDDRGDIALGANARIAIMPWRDNYEDAYVISESFAKKLSSHQSYDYRREQDPEAIQSVKRFVSVLPSSFSKDQLAKLDPDGVIQVGQTVRSGDPLVLDAGRKPVNLSKALTRSGHRAYQDRSQVWDHDVDGVVTNVHRSKSGAVSVSIDTESPMQDGDKLAEVFGSKGVVKVIPDDQMVQDPDGNPYDVVSSDLGFISRKNASRAYSILLGKLAAKLGKPIMIEEGQRDDMARWVREQLKNNDLNETETVRDPVSGRRIPGVLAGVQHMMKLSHMSESKSQSRSTGLYASDQTPAKGSEEGQQAKRLSNQELGALVGHGAMAYLQEVATVKGTRNDEWAARYQAGQDLPPTRVPFVYDKFLNYLRGLGVDPVRRGSVTRLQLMADQDIDRLAGNREVRVAETVLLHRDMKPLPGGLFDPAIFGDDGKQFAKYKLQEPIPNPLLEKPLRSLMGVTEKQYRDILSGQEQFGTFGRGPQAIAGWLKRLDPEKQQAVLRSKIPGAAITTRDRMIKQLRYLDAIQKHNLRPEDLMISRVPIIPPIYRPISKLAGKDSSLIDGMNHLYQQMITADQNLKELSGISDEVSQERLAVYDSVRSAFGLTDPADPELRRKNVSGLMKRITGPRGPKSSMVQSKLLSTTVDHVGRGVILPNANLDLDEIGIPEEQAWEMFRLPVMRRLTRRGMPVHIAKQLIDDRKPVAREALDAEMAERPVTASRAPVLHKFGLMGFMPKIVQGHSLHLNPLVYGGYAADNDGDTMNFHAVITDQAAREVKERMMPSRNLRSVSDFRSPMYRPNQDHLLGLYLASTKKSDQRPVVFGTIQDAARAHARGEIGFDTPVKILARKTK